MTRYLSRMSGFILLAAGLGLGACEGDTGPQGLPGVDGQDGLGFVPMPAADQTLGEYDSNGTPTDATDDPAGQDLATQLDDSTGVWEITMDHQVQIDRGDGTPPIVADTVIFDSDHNELWLMIDGAPVALTDKIFPGGPDGRYTSIGCNDGAPLPCVEAFSSELIYASVFRTFIEHGPAVDTEGFGVFGVKTAVADIPATGSFDYSGDFVGFTTVGGGDNLSGTVDITADYDPAALSVTFASAGDGEANFGSATYTLSGTGTISGNSYSGTLNTASYDADGFSSGAPVDFRANAAIDDLFSGSFYGPASDADDGGLINESETAGVVEATDGTDSLIGGFVAGQTGPTP